MSLQVQSEFTDQDIHGVARLDPARPVFLLAGDRSQLVIKRDMTPFAGDDRNMRYALRNMKAVDASVASRQLSHREVDALHSFVELQRLDAAFAGTSPSAGVLGLAEELAPGGRGNTWLKMNKLEGLVNLESAFLKAKDESDKSGIRAFAAALSAPGGLEKLGMILAVDLFNGNDDRCALGKMPQAEAYHGLHLYRVVNVGNLLVCMDGLQLKPVGLDAYAGRAEFRNVNLAGPPAREWPGWYLRSDGTSVAWRRQFAEDVVEDIKLLLGKRRRRGIYALVGNKDRLPPNAALRLAIGMDSGIVLLRQRLLSMGHAGQRPPGLQARISALWGAG